MKSLLSLTALITSLNSLFGQTNGTTLWTTDLHCPLENSAPVTTTNGTIFITSASNFTALNFSGNVLWQIPLTNSDSAVVAGEKVYIGGVLMGTSGVYSFDTSGETNWVAEGTYGPLALSSNGELYVGPSSGIKKLSSTGELQWAAGTINHQIAFPVIGLDGAIFLGSYHGSIYAFNPDGTERWSDYLATLWDYSPAIDSNGNLCGAAKYEYLLSTAPNGTTNWMFSVANDAPNGIHSAPAIGRYGVIYCTTTNGLFFAVNPNGTKKWQLNVGSPMYSSPAVADDGTIYFGSDNGKINAIFDNETNALWKWKVQTGGSVRSSPTIGADGTVYVGSNDGKLYAIAGSAPLADTAWPMFRHDPQHTARVSRIVKTPAKITTNCQLNDLINITIQGEWNQPYQIQESSNLTEWISVTNFINTNGTFSLTQPMISSFKFFRVTEP